MLKRFIKRKVEAPLATSNLQGDLRLPLELIYIIVDKCSTSTVKSLALTCHTLAAYCRPIILSSIIVNEHQLTSRDFGSLLLRSSDITGHVRTLTLDVSLPLSPSRKGGKFEGLGRNWVPVLEAKYPNLDTLNVVVRYETSLFLQVQSRLFGLILHANNLHTLQLDIQFNHIRLATARFCPPQVKSLILHFHHVWYQQDPPTLDIQLPENRVPPKLQSLTMIGTVQDWTLDLLMNGDVPLMKYGALRHIQLPDTIIQHPPPTIQSPLAPHNAFIQSAFATLQCIHLSFKFDIPPASFSIISLPALKIIEGRVNSPSSWTLGQAMNWLSNMVYKASLERRQELTISLILYCSLAGCSCHPLSLPRPMWDEDKHKDHIFGHREAWKWVVNESAWSDLTLVGGIYAFSDPEPSDRERRPRYLGRYPADPSSQPVDYQSLWKSCICTGWHD
ncbi:hypothetical protein BKA70DRAFT_1256677 [Coprinopsis sp. MPI-PUGE-AT-0042]|nr:hypothetical protein BKA70DRAFT_1256677 [Coprinopsis sp. MPI-PUGE-AT-0042]